MMRESSLPLWAPMLPSSDAKQSYIYNLGMLNQPISTVTSTHTHVLALYLLLECTQITYFKAGGIL